jgi:hypothetical protein
MSCEDGSRCRGREKRQEASRNPLQAIRRLKLVGFAVVVLVVGGADEWAATSRVQGAVIASGTLVVELNIRTLLPRHLTA